jgi:3-deoxy-manno-octulosonate cytidylyltransferase (CMP-KDO synthetase)
MKFAAVIPARLSSRRFPRKVLARDTGKYLVEHVHERIVGCPGIDRVIIATDNREVQEAGKSFGAEVILTSADHLSGTDRVAEVAQALAHDVIINVQGDEPYISHEDLTTLMSLFREPAAVSPARPREVVMSTLVVERSDREGFGDPNIVKAVVGKDGYALYFSRSPVPFHEAAAGAGGASLSWFQHIGIYAYRREFLLQLATLPPTALEKRERLEQLRVLENGYVIRVGRSEHAHLGIDTPEEYRTFVEEFRRS